MILERKVLRGAQLRTGPNNCTLQTVVDRLKLLNKPSALNNMFSFTFLVIMIITCNVTNVYCVVIIILRIIIIIIYGAVLGNNLYSKIGTYRIVVLAWRYDLLLLIIFNVLKVIVFCRILYYVLSCEVGRTPIDLIEGESELVSRFNTEYSGGEFVRFFLGEYMGIILLLGYFCVMEMGTYIIFIFLVIIIRASYPRIKINEVVMSM